MRGLLPLNNWDTKMPAMSLYLGLEGRSSKLTVMVWVSDQTADVTVVVVGYYEAI